MNSFGYDIIGSRSISTDYVTLFDETAVYDYNIKHVYKVFSDLFQVEDIVNKNFSKAAATDYVSFAGWDYNLQYSEVSGQTDAWYNINNDYNYPWPNISVSSFFDVQEQFFEGGFFAKQLEIVE